MLKGLAAEACGAEEKGFVPGAGAVKGLTPPAQPAGALTPNSDSPRPVLATSFDASLEAAACFFFSSAAAAAAAAETLRPLIARTEPAWRRHDFLRQAKT